jgi:predicted ester cyclase
MIDETVTRRIVTEFLTHVRSGRDLSRTADLMAPVVLAHQVQSEDEATIERTPQNYADHVREMIETWGDFTLEVQELLVDGARAYVRLVQIGRHAATGRTVRQTNSIVYHVEDRRITQYWMQIDRAGLAAQLAEAPGATSKAD